MSFLVLANIRWNHYFYSFSCFTLFWSKKKFWPKQIVCTKMRVFFSLPDTNSVRQFLQKNPFFFLIFSYFWMTTLKKTYFYRVFGFFPFSFFLPFLFLYLQHKKGKKQKMQFSFRKPHFWHSQNFAKTLFWHTVALFVFLKMPKKHYTTGEKTAKKNLDQF